MPIYAETRRACLAYPVTPEQIARLNEDARREDRNEWVGALGPVPLTHALAVCTDPKLMPGAIAMASWLKADGRMLAIFGAHAMPEPFVEQMSCDPDAGLLWFAATETGYNHIPDFAVLTTKGLEFLHATYPHLIAFTDDRNPVHHAWLIDMGFEFHPTPYVIGPWSLPYWKVERKRSD